MVELSSDSNTKFGSRSPNASSAWPQQDGLRLPTSGWVAISSMRDAAPVPPLGGVRARAARRGRRAPRRVTKGPSGSSWAENAMSRSWRSTMARSSSASCASWRTICTSGRSTAKRREEAREDLGADALHEAHPQPAAVAGGDGVDVGLGDAEGGEHRAGVLEEHLAGGGEAHRLRAAGPVEHGRAGGALQRGDLLAHRRLACTRGRSAALPKVPASATATSACRCRTSMSIGARLSVVLINWSRDHRFCYCSPSRHNGRHDPLRLPHLRPPRAPRRAVAPPLPHPAAATCCRSSCRRCGSVLSAGTSRVLRAADRCPSAAAQRRARATSAPSPRTSRGRGGAGWRSAGPPARRP